MSQTEIEADGLTIILVRPGTTNLDEQERITGNLDVPLSAEGERQVQQIAAAMAPRQLDRIYAAPGVAGEATARALSQGGRVKIRFDERLANMNFGLWQGRRIAEVREAFPKHFKTWCEHPRRICPPEGETIDQLAERASRFLNWLERKHKQGTIVLIAAEPMASVLANTLRARPAEDSWCISGQFGTWHLFDRSVLAATAKTA